MGSFCLYFKRAPRDLVALSESELYNIMLDYVSFMEKSGKQAATLNPLSKLSSLGCPTMKRLSKEKSKSKAQRILAS
jgi:hypothetical protein